MSDLYLDEIEKIEYYKKKIVDQYLEEGSIISNTVLHNKINDLDLKICIFKQGYIDEGETLNLDKFNDQKYDIYQDLCILYKVAYKIARKKITRVEHKLDCELEDLYEIGKKYDNRTEFEAKAIYGNTILFSTSDFEQEYKDGNVYVNLGAQKIPSGSYLACYFECGTVDSCDAHFEFLDNSNNVLYSIENYPYAKKYLKMVGNYERYTSKITYEEANVSEFQVKIDTINEKSAYNLFVGEDKLCLTNTNGYTKAYVDKIQNIPLVIDYDCEITFYVYGSSIINIDLIGDCEYKSFVGNSIQSPRFTQKILIKAKEGLSIDIQTDGLIFADKALCEIEDGQLICPKGYEDVKDFMLEEIRYGDDLEFANARVVIENSTTTFHDIDYVAIKQSQITELDGDLE